MVKESSLLQTVSKSLSIAPFFSLLTVASLLRKYLLQPSGFPPSIFTIASIELFISTVLLFVDSSVLVLTLWFIVSLGMFTSRQDNSVSLFKPFVVYGQGYFYEVPTFRPFTEV